MQVNVHEAKTQLSPLLELVKEGETVVIARGEPIAVPGDDWWQPLSDAEAEDWIEGR
jgi:hypothetical protein